MKTTNILSIVIVLLVIALIGVTTSFMSQQTSDATVSIVKTMTEQPASFSDESIHKFKDEEELIAYLSTGSSDYYGGIVPMAATRDIAMDVESSSVKTAVGSNDFSETNVQVEGIDEGDLIKTDGEYIYTITDNTLFIVKADPAKDTKVISQETFKSRPSGLLLVDDLLVVYGSLDWMISRSILPNGQMSFVRVYDVSDKENIELENELQFEGYISQTREKDGNMYIVSNAYANFADGYPTPIIMENDVLRVTPVKDIRYIGLPYSPNQFTTVRKIEIDSFEQTEQTIVTNSGTTVYMSHENMYLATTVRINEWEIAADVAREMITEFLTDEDKEKISRINAVASDILSQGEKDGKIQQIYEQRVYQLAESVQEKLAEEIEEETANRIDKIEYFTHTAIQRIDLTDLDLEATGKVPGQLNNQFALDEYENVLRVATTIDARWDRKLQEQSKSNNHIYTLDENLEQLDSITGLAEDERIFATRFVNERLYMVTFRQVDPFFVVDLADATNIKVLGELKIPGFSRYLHPYDEDTIIGIGQDADPKTGRAQGLKISLFDVSDVANPIESAQFVTDEKYARSQALYEHKAFLFDKQKQLLVIPAYSPNNYWDEESKNNQQYNGAFVFNITIDNIALRGLIDHDTGTGNYWQPQVERSLYINDNLFTKSPYLLRVNDLDDLSSVANVTLSVEKDGEIIVY